MDEWAPVCADGLTFANWHALYCADPLAAARPAAWLPGACADDDRRALTDAAHDDGSGAGANGTTNGAHRNAALLTTTTPTRTTPSTPSTSTCTRTCSCASRSSRSSSAW